MMYVVINKNNKIVGYHNDEDIVIEYVIKYNKSNDKDSAKYEYVKDKKFKKHLKKHPEDDNKYLLQYNNTFVPQKFLDSESLFDNDFINDVKYSKNTIHTLLCKYEDFDNKQIKSLMKAYLILDRVINDVGSFTQSYDQLVYNKNHISELMDSNDIYRYDIN